MARARTGRDVCDGNRDDAGSMPDGDDDAGASLVIAPLFRQRGRSVSVSLTAPVAERVPAPRPLHVARMLAVAHEIVRLIADGTFVDQADVARVIGFTRARVSQLVDLTLLAPAIQEELLFAQGGGGHDRVTERSLRALLRRSDWSEQRAPWAGLAGRPSPDTRRDGSRW